MSLLQEKARRNEKGSNNHQTQMENLVTKLSQSDGIDSSKVQEAAQETKEKATKMVGMYLRDNPDPQEALEFLCLAEGGEVTHYEVLGAMTRGIKNKQFQAKVRSILNQEKITSFCALNWPRKTLLNSNNFFLYFTYL